MKTIKQKHGYDCGQCCVAMVTGSTYQEAVDAVGHINSTKTKDLILAINELGWECDGRLYFSRSRKLILSNLNLGIVKVTFEKRSGWHWIAVVNGTVHDPAYRNTLERGGRPTSFLSVW